MHNASCCAMCMSELKKDYSWIEHESVYLPWEDSPQCAFFWALSGSLLALLASFVHWLCCFHFLNVANRRLRSALNSTKHVHCGGPATLSSASSIVKKRRSSLPSTSLVPRPHPKNQERGLVTLANYLICAESAYYVTITCLLWSCGSQLPLTMALQSRWADLATEQAQGNPVRQE